MKKIFNIMFLLLPVLALAQSPGQNYIKTKTYLKKSTGTITVNDTVVNVAYFDGLGRPIQSVAVKAGGNKQDIITPVVYDSLGRQARSYLPYADASQTVSSPNYRNNSTLLPVLEDYYEARFPGEYTSSLPNPYSETFFEPSPLGRPLEQSAPGNDWFGNPKIDTDHTIKFGYDTNKALEVRKFRVNFTDDDAEVTELECTGYYASKTLLKKIVKDENWTAADGKNHTFEEFTDREGRMVLKRTYNDGLPHDTYYVYDGYGNLTYVIPPLAADDIVERVVNVLSGGANYPWTRLSDVTQQLADDYGRDLQDYDNDEILNVDLIDRYGGMGGFTLMPDEEGNLVLNINVTTDTPMPYRNGVVADLAGIGTFTDMDLGHLKGSGYEYFFLIRGNTLKVTGSGNVPSLNVSFNSSNPPEYGKNYPWSRMCYGDPGVLQHYEDDIAPLDNEDILTTYTANAYGAMGGVAISVDKYNTVNVSLNISATTDLELKPGSVFTLDIQRAIPDMVLGTVTGSGYSYTFSIKSNSLHVVGSGHFQNLSFSATKYSLYTYNTREEVEGLCYIYHYDKRNRVIEKHIPDAGWTHIVYDRLNRPILSQDENLRNKSTFNWLFTKYDKFGRIVYAGAYTDIRARKDIQVERDTVSNPELSETRLTTSFSKNGTNVYYNNVAWPNTLSTIDLHTVNYYDSYGFATATVPTSLYGVVPTTELKGLATGSTVRILGTTQWQKNLLGYDDRGRLIYTYLDNDYLGFTQNVRLDLNFTGTVKESRTVHNKGTSTTIFDYYTYDHMQRPLAHTQKVAGQAIQLIAYNDYNELGQLMKKKVGKGSFASGATYSATTALQEVDYSFNTRGWLTGINNTGANLATGTDLFAFKIYYNTSSETGTQKLYNGNICETHWKSKTDNVLRKYTYTFDDLNRLNKAGFKSTGADGRYNEDILYDKGGNITALQRTGRKTNATYGIIDLLSYHYAPYSNQLMKVTDSALEIEGFNNGATAGNEDYAYDDNGNMVKDFNKGLGTTTADGIAYNYMNLPTLVKVDNDHKIECVYDAIGTKLQKKVTDGAGMVTTTQYMGGFVYENSVMQFYAHEEGYVRRETSGTFLYVYQYKDNLGNVRLSYCDADANGAIAAIEVLEETNYYAFGLQHKGYNTNIYSTNAGQKQKYNGMEWQNELNLNMYDMDFRDYDPAIARWVVIDPVIHYDFSPYNAFDNNPVFWADPSGADAYNLAMKLFNNSGSGMTEYQNNGSGIFEQTWRIGDEDFAAIIGGKQGYADLAFGGGGSGEPPTSFMDFSSNPILEKFFQIMLENSIIGDGKFMVLAHGNDEWMGNFLNGGREEIHTAAEFDKLLGSLNSAYKQYAEDKNKKFVLYLYVCHSATVPAYGGPSMAEKISLAHPNAIIQAFDGYGHFKMEDGKARFIGVSTDMTTNNNQGFYVAFKNGKEIWRVPSDDNLRQMINY